MKSKILSAKNGGAILKTVIVLAVFTWFASTIIQQEFDFSKSRATLADLDNKIVEQTQLKEQLDKQKNEVNTPEFKEKKARERGYIKPGELVFADAQRAKH